MTPSPTYNTTSKSNIAAVLVVVEDSMYGRNYGASKDLEMMTNMLYNVTDDIVVLKNGMGTKKNIKEALGRACQKELAIFYFSGHGGHEKTKDPNEKDGYNEYMCLSDTTMTDDELWEVISQSTNRVFTIFNCCLGETMFQVQKPNMFSASKFINTNSCVNLVSWSGSKENGASFTSVDGGYFTKAIYKSYKAWGGETTYSMIWACIYSNEEMKNK